MKLELTKEMIEALKKREIDFKDVYADEYSLWYKELRELGRLKQKDRLKELLGFTYSSVAQELLMEKEEISIEDEHILKEIGIFGDAKYILDFAIAFIIEDIANLSTTSTPATEALQIENVDIQD